MKLKVKLIILFFFFIGNMNAAVIYVNVNAAGLNNGTSWIDAFNSIQAAIDIAVSGDEIWVAGGTYYPTKEVGGTGSRYRTFELKSDLTVYGGFNGTESTIDQRDFTNNPTVLSGDIGTAISDWNDFNSTGWSDNVFHVLSAISTTPWSEYAQIDGFIIKGGFAKTAASNYGGGVFIYNGGKVNMTNCTIEYNYADEYGGAISNYSFCSLEIYNCMIKKNKSKTDGGGIWNHTTSTLHIQNSEISENSCTSGVSGIVIFNNSNCWIYNSFLKNNTSATFGTLYNALGSTTEMRNCLLSNNTNTSSAGAAITNESAVFLGINLTITANIGVNGSGVYNQNGNMALRNSIICGNMGILGKQLFNGGGGLTLNYSCYSNGTDDVFGTITATDHNIVLDDPMFVDVLGFDYRLYGASPCTDVGENGFTSEFYDIRGDGFGRKLNKTDGSAGTIDMGAYEYKFGSDPLCFGINPTNGGNIGENQDICVNTQPNEITNVDFPSGHTGNIEYQWQSSTTNATEGFSDIVGANSDNYQASNLMDTTWFKRLARVDCASNWENAAESNVVTVAVNPLPEEAGLISGPTVVCQGQTEVNYSVDEIAFAEEYVWTLPDGSNGTSTSNSIDVEFELTALSGSISVMGRNACGDGSYSSLDVLVNEKPVTPIISLNNGNILHSDASTGNQWYNQDGIITGATQQDFFAQQNGDYYDIVSLNGCSSDQSNTITVIISGFDDNDISLDFKIYPVPVFEKLIIETSLKNAVRYEIINSLGQLVYTGIFNEKRIVLTDGLNPGLYYIVFKVGKASQHMSFIKL